MVMAVKLDELIQSVKDDYFKQEQLISARVAIPAMSKTKGRQVHPRGEKMSVSPEERERCKKRRLEKGWDQYDLADKSGLTQGAISGFESGRSKQVYKIVYARIYRALFGPGEDVVTAEPDTWLKIVEGSVDLDEDQRRAVLTMVEQLARRKK